MPHINYFYDLTVTVFIVHDDRVLLVNHPRYKQWIPMGGHVELDEHPGQTLWREIKEETGLTVTIMADKPSVESTGTEFLYTPNYLDVHAANPPHKHIGLTYFALADDENFKLSDEHTDMRWVSEGELESDEYKLLPEVKFYAMKALEKAKSFIKP